MRVVNDEIRHVITISGTTSAEQGYKAFILRGGVISVYRKEINFSATPHNNGDWLIPLCAISERQYTAYPKVELPRDLMIYYYIDETIPNVLEDSQKGMDIIVKALGEIQNMDNLFIWYMKFLPSDISFRRWNDDSIFDEEGLYYLQKTYSSKKIIQAFDQRLAELEKSSLQITEKEEHESEIIEWKLELLNFKSQFECSPDNYEKGRFILIRQYNDNIISIKEHGLNINKKNLYV